MRVTALIPWQPGHAIAEADNAWLGFQVRTARRLASTWQRDLARMHGEIFGLTGEYLAGWPCRYLQPFIDGQVAAGHFRRGG